MSLKNRTIVFQDIIAIGDKGEYKKGSTVSTKPLKRETLNRLLDHIKFIFAQAVEAHASKIGSVGKSEELVTRLVLSEFSLYTRKKPLSLEQYKTIIAEVSVLAKSLLPNIHILLATFPVLWPDETLHNVALHIQGALNADQKPILHHITKKVPSDGDLEYRDRSQLDRLYPFHGRELVRAKHATLMPDTVLMDTAVTVNDINQHGGALKITTQSGNTFILELEICNEHFYSYGIYDTKQLIMKLLKNGCSVPENGSHVLTSRTIKSGDKRTIAGLTHADQDKIDKTLPSRLFKTPVFGKTLELYFKPFAQIESLKIENISQADYSSYTDKSTKKYGHIDMGFLLLYSLFGNGPSIKDCDKEADQQSSLSPVKYKSLE